MIIFSQNSKVRDRSQDLSSLINKISTVPVIINSFHAGSIRAHKLLLSSISPVFKKMFFGKFKVEEEVNTSLLIIVLR